MELPRKYSEPRSWSLLALIVIIVAFDHTTHAVSSSAHDCFLSTEPDGSAGGRVRFVLPSGYPCSCTHVKLGGHNTYAPPRKDRPVYIEILPMDVEGLRRSQRCPEISTNADVTSAAPSTTVNLVYIDCQDALDSGHITSGVYSISINGISTQVFCDLQPGSQRKGFIVIQRRINGSVNFDRIWAEYQDGFGDLEGEFWWGNNKLRELTDTESISWELVVDLEAFDGSTASVRYEGFSLGGATYDLNANEFQSIQGNAGDALIKQHSAFKTKDNITANSAGGRSCIEKLNGGWWHDKCRHVESNLNGRYSQAEDVADYQGVQWSTWQGSHVSLKGCQMKIRRK